MSIARDIEGDVNPLSAGDPGIDLVLQPVLGYFSLNDLDIVGILCAEITAAAGDAKPALGAAGGEAAVTAADRPAFAESDLIGFLLWHGFWLCLGSGRTFLR